jgi:hypothetical protein
MSPPSFLGRLDIWTQRLNDWLGAFPRWHGGTWANPPKKLAECAEPIGLRGFVDGPADTLAGIEPHPSFLEDVALEVAQRVGEWGEVGYNCGSEPAAPPLNTFGPGVDPSVPHSAVTDTATLPRADLRAIHESAGRIARTVEQIRADHHAETDRIIDEVRAEADGETLPQDEITASRAHKATRQVPGGSYVGPAPADIADRIDPRVIEGGRQEELPPHAKNLGQKPTNLPPGRGKGKGTNRRKPDLTSKSQWKGRRCKECGRQSGGPRSAHCQYCFEPFVRGRVR